MSETKKEGWSWLQNAPKGHYFVDGRSLCGKWGLFVRLNADSLEQGNDESADNCTACKKALTKRRTKLLAEKLEKEGKVIL